MDFPTEHELAEIGIRELVTAPKSQISVDVARTDATDANILVHVSAAMADDVVGDAARVEAGAFLDSCKGQALDKYLWDRYRLKRPGAVPAFNSIFFSTTAAAVAAFQIPQSAIVQTPDGIQYTVIAEMSYPVGTGAGTGIYVSARSVLAGASQRTAASIANPVTLSILSQIPGAPVDLFAKFDRSSSGGADEMGDDQYRQIGRDFFANAALGTLDAIEARAKRVNGVVTARAFEVLTPEGRPQRYVVLVISDTYTEAYAKLDVQPPRYLTQSQLLASAVAQALRDTRGAGMAVVVLLGQVVLLPIAMTLAFVAGADYNAVALAARVAVMNYTNALRGGESWEVDKAQAKLRGVVGLAYTGSEISSPSGDVVPKSGQLLRTDLRLCLQLGGPNPADLIGGP